MAGGQRGLSFVGEPMVFAVGATALIMILLYFVACSDLNLGEQSPTERLAVECEQASADELKGQADDEDMKLLGSSFCVQHLAVVAAEVQAENQQRMQEAQTAEVAP